jgi:hypothetical protein
LNVVLFNVTQMEDIGHLLILGLGALVLELRKLPQEYRPLFCTLEWGKEFFPYHNRDGKKSGVLFPKIYPTNRLLHPCPYHGLPLWFTEVASRFGWSILRLRSLPKSTSNRPQLE